VRLRLGVGVFLLAVNASVSQAQDLGVQRGRVVDELARPVSFAQIEVRPGNRRLIADANGEFTIAALAEGEYEFRIRRIGYSPANVAVRIPHNESVLSITMTSLPRVLDSVRIRERATALRYTGVVVDDFNQPVVGAEVIAAGASDHGVRTDSAGHFRLAKAQRGTIVLRIRKFGYTPYFGSLSLRSEREDTIRVKRHAQDLPEAYIRAESGFGRDTFAYIELDSRLRWKASNAGIASREDLDRFGNMDLCQALVRTPAGAKREMRSQMCPYEACVLIDGLRPTYTTLGSFMASEVEAVELHPRDQTGTIANRIGTMCGMYRGMSRFGGGVVLWLRKRPP
jgi:Carboxypeptidase regulatory-like domain